MKLSTQQQAVIDTILNPRGGSFNVIARAGTGKTFTLVRGAIDTIVRHNLGELAIMAYNKAAGDEFKERIEKLAKEYEADGDFAQAEGLRNWRGVQAGTVHSFGFSAVRRWSKGVQVDDKKVSGIIRHAADHAAEKMNHRDGVTRYGPDDTIYGQFHAPIAKLVSLAKQSAFGFSHSIDDRSGWFDLAVHHAIDEDMGDDHTLDEIIEPAIWVLKKSIRMDKDVVDFDDMILAPLVHNLFMYQKDWVLIDEAQDTNAARRALALKILKPKTGRMIAVGDDRQAIYGFTGADANSLDLIAEATNASRLPLTVTYRCPKKVVAEANRLVPDLVAHETAPEGTIRCIPMEYVENASDPENAVTHHWFEGELLKKTDAILCRNTKPLVETAYAMLGLGIACRVEGREIGEGLIKLATKWKRIKTLAALADKLEEYQEREIQKWLAKEREDRAQAIEDKVGALVAILDGLRADGKTDVADLVAFIENLFGDTKPGETPKVITLSTIHKSKGREWPTVYLLFRHQTLPSPYARKPWQLHQEENLEYVAITRAQEELVYVD